MISTKSMTVVAQTVEKKDEHGQVTGLGLDTRLIDPFNDDEQYNDVLEGISAGNVITAGIEVECLHEDGIMRRINVRPKNRVEEKHDCNCTQGWTVITYDTATDTSKHYFIDTNSCTEAKQMVVHAYSLTREVIVGAIKGNHKLQ